MELICLFPAVELGGGIADETGMPRNCSRNGRNMRDCALGMLNWPFVI